MARGVRKPIEDKVAEKKALIESLIQRIKNEEAELAELEQEKMMKDLESLQKFMNENNLTSEEAIEILKNAKKDK